MKLAAIAARTLKRLIQGVRLLLRPAEIPESTALVDGANGTDESATYEYSPRSVDYWTPTGHSLADFDEIVNRIAARIDQPPHVIYGEVDHAEDERRALYYFAKPLEPPTPEQKLRSMKERRFHLEAEMADLEEEMNRVRKDYRVLDVEIARTEREIRGKDAAPLAPLPEDPTNYGKDVE